jgi:hypothetical protein
MQDSRPERSERVLDPVARTSEVLLTSARQTSGVVPFAIDLGRFVRWLAAGLIMHATELSHTP